MLNLLRVHCIINKFYSIYGHTVLVFTKKQKQEETILCAMYCGKKRNFEYIKLDRDKSTFKSHRDFSSEIEITFKHF